jgi:hypothetical protein
MKFDRQTAIEAGQKGGSTPSPLRTGKKQVITKELLIELAEMDPVQGIRRARAIARSLVNKAIDGDVSAAKEIADRVEGKAAQPIVGDQDNPLVMVHRIERVMIDDSSQD